MPAATSTTMFSAEPQLHARRPSPTSVEFIVSTRRPRQTLSARVLGILVVLLRLGVGSVVLLLLSAKFLGSNVPSGVSCLLPFRNRSSTHELWNVAAEQEWWRIVLVALALSYAIFRRGYCGELTNDTIGC